MVNTSLTHFDQQGQAHMVDVGAKADTLRVAVAVGSITLSEIAFAYVKAGNSKKGDVLGVARIAAIGACKQTSHLIPLCHPLPLSRVAVEFSLDESSLSVHITVTAQTVGKTGVEMEALTGASIGLLTIYDMLKAVDKGMTITQVQLLKKQGGKSGDWQRDVTLPSAN